MGCIENFDSQFCALTVKPHCEMTAGRIHFCEVVFLSIVYRHETMDRVQCQFCGSSSPGLLFLVSGGKY